MLALQGVFSPIATPFDYEGNIYRAKLRHNLQRWNQVALSGYIVGGSTGEAKLLTTEEKLQLWEWVAEDAAPDKILIAGAGAESVKETVYLINEAAKRGYRAALVINPSYYKNLFSKPEAQLLYFRSVADQAHIPVLIYNLPQNTGIDLSVETIAQLSDHPNIIGIKESSGNVAKVIRLVKECSPDFQVLVGHAPTFWPSLMVGARGGILAMANVVPFSLVIIWEAFRTRDYDNARDWQARIAYPGMLVTAKYGIPGLKYAMDLKGYYGGPARLPLPPLSQEAKKEIEQHFANLPN